MKTYFTNDEALEDIKECLENSYSGYYCELHNEVFNTDYYILGTYEAKQALEQYGVFNAIEKVQEYEQENFGEVNTDLSDPEKLANMLYYIVGEETISLLDEKSKTFRENWNNCADDETNKKILTELDGVAS